MYGVFEGLRVATAEPAATSVLAFVTTLHLSLALLRQYRPRVSSLVIVPSLFFTASPWFLSSPAWLTLAFASHIAWFVACERLVPPAAAAEPKRSEPVARAVPAARKRAVQQVDVLATLDETGEIRTLRLSRPAGFDFTAGQFLMVHADVEGTSLTRCYSITSPPSATGILEIAVRRQGIVSDFIHGHVRAGNRLKISGPGGAFIYPAGSRPVVLIAGGVGITPLLSMLRHGLAAEPTRAFALLLSARTAPQVPFLDELRVLARRHPATFRLAVALSGGCDDTQFYSGRIDRALIDAVVGDLASHEFLICGPETMIDDVRGILEDAGVPATQVHYEKFAIASAPHATAGDGAATTVRLAPDGREIEVAPAQTILEAAEAAGCGIASMCRVGVCGTCAVRLVAGEVEGDFAALDEQQRREGWVLACVAHPVTNCTVEVSA